MLVSNNRLARAWTRFALSTMILCAGLLLNWPVPSGAQPVAPTVPAEPVVITDLVVESYGDTAELRVLADGDLVWTQYRDDQGRLIVELTNATVAPGVGPLTPANNLIASVDVEVEDGERPLTRLIIVSARPTEYTLVGDGGLLSLGFSPVAAAPSPPPQELAVPAEPLAPSQAEPGGEPQAIPQAQPQPEPPAPRPVVGSPERPAVGARPTGVVASALRDIEIVDSGDRPLVKLVGDGSFSYSTFVLDDEPRFVIDLDNVVNERGRREIEVGSALLQRIRVSQFRSAPEPVSRVVLDLTSLDELPTVEATEDGLWIHFEPGFEPSESGTLTQAQEPPAPVQTPAVSAEEAAPVGEAQAEVSVPAETTEAAPVVAEQQAAEEPVPAEGAQASQQPSATEAAQVAALEEPSQQPPSEVPVEPQEPLEIAIATPSEEQPGLPPAAPPGPTSDVSLFESQEIRIDTPQQPSEETAPRPTFGVQAVGDDKTFTGAPVTLSLKDADVTEVLRAFAQQFDLNIVIQPGVSGTVTVELVEVPWDQALDIILRTNGLGMTLEGSILRIAPISRLAQEAQAAQELANARALSLPLTTVMKRISYATANDVASILAAGRGTGIMSQRGSVTVDRRTNTLIIRELPDYLNTVIQVIENLDIPEKQVMIEARIVETSRNWSRSLGISWSFNGVADPIHGNTTGLQFPNNVTSDGGVNLLRGGANGFFNLGLGNVLNTFQLDLALQAAETEGLVNVISAPKVATLNNEAASIQTGLQIPIQTVANNTVSVQFVNATLSLRVTPHVTADGTILLTINIQKREPQLGLLIAGATNAPIATREARTKVFVRDGGTAVIGGIYTVSANDSRDRVPGLANIPILGHLFRNKERQSQNEELLIFITPRIIRL